MTPDDKIRSAFSDLQRRSRQDVDARAGLNRVKGAHRPHRLVPALAAAGVVAVAIGGFAILGLLSGQSDPDDIVAPPSTVASTTTTAPGTTVPAAFPGADVAGTPFVVSSTVDEFSAGFLGQPALLSGPAEIRSAFTDGSGGLVYLSGDQVVWLTGQGETRSLSSGVDALAGVYTDGGRTQAIYVTSANGTYLAASTLTADPGDREDYFYDIGWVEGRVLDVDVDAANVVVLVERDRCRAVLIGRNFTSGGAVSVAPIDHGTCLAQQDGWPRAVAISGDRVVVAESATAGEIEFTYDEVAVYDLEGTEISRHRIDTYLDIEVSDIDLAGSKALVAGEYLWVLDLESGNILEVNDPFKTGAALIRAGWTTSQWAPSDQVIAFRVTGVAADDVLNVRVDPDPTASILARLTPNYAAIGDTGETAITADGGKWRRVTLLDPVRLEGLGEPLDGGTPTGWVNEAFLESLSDRLPVTAVDVPACQGPSTDSSLGSGQTPDHIYSVWMSQVGRCMRLVITLGTGFDASFPDYDAITTDPGPVTGIPAYRLSHSDGEVTVNFPEVTQVWQFGTDRDGAFVVRETDGSLSVTVLTATDEVVVTSLPGRIVVDMADPTPSKAVNLVAISPIRATPDGEIMVTGVARPFEATLHIDLFDGTTGNPVEATFEGSSFLGTVTARSYAVMTTDYAEAWGRFAFKISGLLPGEYSLFLSSDGADEPFGAEFSFTVGG